jgi:hypothetical protein
MRPGTVVAAALVFLALVAPAWAAEPLIGTWRLDHQEINGEKSNAGPLTLKVSAASDKLAFAFSVPVDKIYLVSMSYTVGLDGTEADVKNSQGEKVGTVQMKAAGPSQYSLVLRGLKRPPSSTKLVVSDGGKTLTCASESGDTGNPTQSVQVFSRY